MKVRLSGIAVAVALAALTSALLTGGSREVRAISADTHATISAAATVSVVAVADITVESKCEETWSVYRDEAMTDLVSLATSRCSQGQVLHTRQMSEGEARTQGLRYVVLTGDPTLDDPRVDAMKAEMRPRVPRDDGTSGGGEFAPISLHTSTACTQYYYHKYLTYFTPNLDPGSDPGGAVRFDVYYMDKAGDCDRIIVWYSDIRFVVAPNPGQDLYWDRQIYGSPPWYHVQRDAGCKRILTSPTQVITDDWDLLDDMWWTDETINDTSFGCDWWGEEFQGSTQLLTW